MSTPLDDFTRDLAKLISASTILVEMPEKQYEQLPEGDKAKLKLWWEGVPWHEDWSNQQPLDEVPLTFKYLRWLREGYEMLEEMQFEMRRLLQAVVDEEHNRQLRIQSNSEVSIQWQTPWHQMDELKLVRRLDGLFPYDDSE